MFQRITCRLLDWFYWNKEEKWPVCTGNQLEGIGNIRGDGNLSDLVISLHGALRRLGVNVNIHDCRDLMHHARMNYLLKVPVSSDQTLNISKISTAQLLFHAWLDRIGSPAPPPPLKKGKH